MAGQSAVLQLGRSVVLNASGAGQIEVGPAIKGPPLWHVTGVIIQTNRPGAAPVPRAQVYQDTQDANGIQGLTYDGSFASGTCDITLTRGQVLICKWTGGQSGDIASFTVSGEKHA